MGQAKLFLKMRMMLIQSLLLNVSHDNCIELMAPSTLMKVGEKFLQLAATNCTDGGHFNTRPNIKLSRTSLSWRLYWNLVGQHRRGMKKKLIESSQDSPKGFVFNFEEFRKLVTTRYEPARGIDFLTWITSRFPAVTLLLGALRSEQLERFRLGGMEAITWLHNNVDDHYIRNLYLRYKCKQILKFMVISVFFSPFLSFRLTKFS